MASSGSHDEAPRAAPDPNSSLLQTEGLLWLEDQADTSAAESGNGAPADAPWRRGLRG
jgi:hypothetical protein